MTLLFELDSNLVSFFHLVEAESYVNELTLIQHWFVTYRTDNTYLKK